MAGGSSDAWERVEEIFRDISAKFDGEPCAALVGPEGAGHFVKTIHNGIEYADMQMIAEVYGIMRDGLGLTPARWRTVFAAWNEGPLKSYLIEITAKVLDAIDPKTGKPLVDVILDTAGQKGTGRWSAMEAQDLGVPATVIEAAVAARALSARKARAAGGGGAVRRRAARKFDGAFDGDTVLRSAREALLAGKIAAYAQGFAVMAKASETWNWNLPLGTVAKIWRAGCIIRSVFLDDIAKAYAANGDGRQPDDDRALHRHAEGHVNGSLRAGRRRSGAEGDPGAGAFLGARLFRPDRGRRARPPTSPRRSAISSAPTASSAIDEPGKVAHGPWAMG